MPAYNFQKRFAPAIRSGAKAHTIRPNRKHNPKPGDRLYLFTGQRTKTCERLLDTVCLEAIPILIQAEGDVALGDTNLSPEAIRALAVADGLRDEAEFYAWFVARYGLPFFGVLIKWQPPTAFPFQPSLW